jgi:hypothetical protein
MAPGLLGTNADVREVIKQSKNVKEPQNHGDDHHTIQYRFDRGLHRDKTIDEPEHHADNDQNQDDLN